MHSFDKYFLILDTISDACNDIVTLRKITNLIKEICTQHIYILQNPLLCLEKLTVELNRENVDHLTASSTSFPVMKLSISRAEIQIHAKAEIVLKWWSQRKYQCSDEILLYELLKEIGKENPSYLWLIGLEPRVNDLVKRIDPPSPREQGYWFYHCESKDDLSKLIQCIKDGDGTPLDIPKIHIRRSGEMEDWKQTDIKDFTYNPAYFPLFPDLDHWYLVCCYNNSIISKDNKFISFYIHTQSEIVQYLSSCHSAYLYWAYSEITAGLEFSQRFVEGISR